MIIRWTWLLAAFVVLAPPPILSSDLRRVLISTRRNASLRVTSLARPWQNWLDLARAALGTLILTGVAITSDPLKEESASKPLLLQALILAAAALFQVLRVDRKASRSEQKFQLLAPIFYLCGITLALSGLSGVFAVFVGWIFAVAARNPAYQLPAMGVALVAAGYYVFGLNLLILTCNVALILIPFLSAFALRRRLVFVGLEPNLSGAVLKPALK